MSSLILHDLADDVVAGIARRAAANARSVEAEAESILRDAVTEAHGGSDPWDEVERIAAMTPATPQTDSVAMLREDRTN